MAVKTIHEYDEAASAGANDELLIWLATQGVTRKITKANLLGGTMTGAGTIATGGYTLTVPATGTAALLGATQTLSGAKTFSSLITASAGITFGDDTLSFYDKGSWDPELSFDNLSTGITYSTRTGRYLRIGSIVYMRCDFTLTSKGSATGNARISGPSGLAPVASENTSIRWSNMASNFVDMSIVSAGSSTDWTVRGLKAAGASSAAIGSVTHSDFADNSAISFTMVYGLFLV